MNSRLPAGVTARCRRRLPAISRDPIVGDMEEEYARDAPATGQRDRVGLAWAAAAAASPSARSGSARPACRRSATN